MTGARGREISGHAGIQKIVFTGSTRTGQDIMRNAADTLKRLGVAGEVLETVDRAPLVAAQTPQGFVREQLAAAHENAQSRQTDPPGNDAPTDDAELVQRAGGTVRVVAGSHRAHKLTTPADLAMLRGLLSE